MTATASRATCCPGVAQNGFPLRPGLGTGLRHQAGTLPGGLLPRFGQHAFPLLGSRAEDVRAFGFGLHPHHAFLRLDFGELLAGFPRRIERRVDVMFPIVDRLDDDRKAELRHEEEHRAEGERHPEQQSRFGL